jgi:predicted alpha-1,6-mannanase (GH76 family)
MEERWDHRADLAEQAVEERHCSRLWAIPRTNLAVVSWPPTTRDKLFYHWHIDWQAQYLDCQADAAERRSRKSRLSMIRRTVRAVRIRNLGPLPKHTDYDDKAWLTLALHRVHHLERYGKVRYLHGLEDNIFAGVDELTGVLPWTPGDTYYNVPTNGPVAVLAARSGRPELAAQLLNWIYTHLVDADGLITDGLRMTLSGPERVDEIRAANQGIVLGALVEIARNGKEALEALEQASTDPSKAVDLVLMDVMMPVMDGLTATREMRKDPRWKTLPVLMLTAKAMPDDQERCMAAGANDYMAKPLDVDKLLSLVRVWMPR